MNKSNRGRTRDPEFVYSFPKMPYKPENSAEELGQILANLLTPARKLLHLTLSSLETHHLKAEKLSIIKLLLPVARKLSKLSSTQKFK